MRLLMAFLLTLVVGSLTPLHAYVVRAEHPRIWLTPQNLAYLKGQVTANSTRWQMLKAAADSTQADVPVMAYALAYQMTGNVVYADRAIARMQEYVNQGMTAVSQDSGYGAKEVLPPMAIGYDWCYDRLTATQRTQFRTQMEAWTDWVWPETNPSRGSGWAIDNPKNNYYGGFMMTWMSGLALYGDSPKAQGYIDLARGKWLNKVKPYLLSGAAGGYFEEGTNYGMGSTMSLSQYLLAHETATDEPIFTGMSEWLKQYMLCKIHITTPSMDRSYPGGDQARESHAPLSDYDRMMPLAIMAHLDDTTAGYARWWLDHITPNINQWRFTRWYEFLWYRDNRLAIDYRTVLPTEYFAPGAGLMLSRSSWNADATQVVMVCGPVEESHQDRAANAFMIWRGDWLAAHARINSHSGLLGETEFNNSLLFGGVGQYWETDPPRAVKFESAPDYSYFSGDAAGPYKHPQNANLVRKFQRDLVFLKEQGIVVILDTVDTVSPSLSKRWLLQTLTDPILGSDTYQVNVGGNTLRGRRLLPVGAAITKGGVNESSSGGLSSWRIAIETSGRSVDRFLNVMQVGAAGFTPLTESLVSETVDGVQVRVGNHAVAINANAQTVSVQLDGGPPPSPIDTSQVLSLVNQQRTANGLQPLTRATELDVAAQRHSLDMATAGFFSHTGSDGSTGGDRIRAAGYAWSAWAENIAAGQPTVASVMNEWLASAGHRANILNPNVREMGIAVVWQPGSQYGYYWTQAFGVRSVTPPPPPVNQAPVARIAGPSTGLAGQSLTFNGVASSDADGAIVSYRWAFGTGSSADGATVGNTFASPGVYSVMLTVTDNLGAVATATMPVTVTALPPPPPPPVVVTPPKNLIQPGFRVVLTWAQSASPNIQSNRIYRATDPNGAWALLVTVTPRTTWTDTNLVAGRPYFYRVTAINTAGVESAPSNVAETRAQ